MRLLLVKIFILVSISCFGQGGQIVGRVTMTDRRFSANYLTLVLELDNIEVGGTVPDSNGNFKIDRINKGTYDLVIRQIGYRDAVTNGLVITGDTLINLDLVYPPPCAFTTDKNPKCIDGHTDKIIPMVYGLPNNRTMQKSKKGKVHLAGCNVTGCDPQFYCTIHKQEL
jgi:hypothetical protein